MPGRGQHERIPAHAGTHRPGPVRLRAGSGLRGRPCQCLLVLPGREHLPDGLQHRSGHTRSGGCSRKHHQGSRAPCQVREGGKGGEGSEHHLPDDRGSGPDRCERDQLRQGVPERAEGIPGDRACVVFERGECSAEWAWSRGGIAQSVNSVKSFNKMRSSLSSKGGSKTINPNEIRFSQSSVNGASEIIDSMKMNGWTGEAIDVVRMPDGKLTTIDNTRVLAARYAEIDVQANVHAYDELLSNNLIERFTTSKGSPKTWGEAVSLRIGKQNSKYRSLYPQGSNITGWKGN